MATLSYKYLDFTYGYRRVIKTMTMGNKTLNWACPKCNRVLVQQRGGLSYDQHEQEDMRRRLQRNNYVTHSNRMPEWRATAIVVLVAGSVTPAAKSEANNHD